MRFFLIFLSSLCVCLLFSGPLLAEDIDYGGVKVSLPESWKVSQEAMFSGAVPSRAWLLRHADGSEALLSILVTEGVVKGLEGQAESLLAKIYVEAFAVAWGAEVKGSGEGKLASYCGGRGGYHLVGSFEGKRFDYYGCARLNGTSSRAFMVVVWDSEGWPESAAQQRLEPFLESLVGF